MMVISDSVIPTVAMASGPRRPTKKTSATAKTDSMNISRTIGTASNTTALPIGASVKSWFEPRTASLSVLQTPVGGRTEAADCSMGIRTVYCSLFPSQRNDWVHGGGAARRPDAGKDGDQDEKHGRADEAEGIGRRHVVEDRAHKRRDESGSDGTNRDAGASEDGRLAENHPEHVAAAGSERNTNPNLLGPLFNRVRQHAVDADRRKQQRERAEDRKHPAEEAITPETEQPVFFTRPEIEQRNEGIGLPDFLSDLRRD